MKTDDRQHVDAICLRHGIKYMNRFEAMLIAIKCGKYSLAMGRSFSIYNDLFRGIYVNEGGDKEDDTHFGINVSPENRDEHDYFIAMHELGHNVLRQEPLSENDHPARCKQEIEAWEWAFTHAQYWPCDEVVCAALNATSSYTHVEEAIARGELSHD